MVITSCSTSSWLVSDDGLSSGGVIQACVRWILVAVDNLADAESSTAAEEEEKKKREDAKLDEEKKLNAAENKGDP